LLVGYLIFEQLYLYSQAEKKTDEKTSQNICVFFMSLLFPVGLWALLSELKEMTE